MRPLLFLTLLLGLSCQSGRVESQSQMAFDQVWKDFADTYPYFAHKQVNWDSIYKAFEPRFKQISNQKELFAEMAEMLGSLQDIHVNLNGAQQEFRYEKRGQYPSNPADNAHAYLGKVHYENGRVLYADLPGSSAAYLRVESFEGSVNNYTQFPTETIISSIAQKDGLIIDLRDNPGGKEDFARAFVNWFVPDSRAYKYTRSRLTDDPESFSPWQVENVASVNPIEFSAPILLLTNRGCYSATESFVLMMRTLPTVTVIGDTTGGATGNPIVGHLSNGWRYTLPTSQVADLDFRLIEDHGIAPDVVVQMDETSLEEGRDVMLEKALELL